MENKQEYCSDCDVFKNHQVQEFSFGFFCPIKDNFVIKDECDCEWIVSDNLPF